MSDHINTNTTFYLAKCFTNITKITFQLFPLFLHLILDFCDWLCIYSLPSDHINTTTTSLLYQQTNTTKITLPNFPLLFLTNCTFISPFPQTSLKKERLYNNSTEQKIFPFHLVFPRRVIEVHSVPFGKMENTERRTRGDTRQAKEEKRRARKVGSSFFLSVVVIQRLSANPKCMT